MREHVVVVNDCAAPSTPGIHPIRSRDTDFGTKNFTLGFDELAGGLPRQLASRELDWLEILGHLFATDVACERGYGDIEWSRSIRVWLPVRDPDYWETRRRQIEGIWTALTDDDLQITFENEASPRAAPRMEGTAFREHDGVSLVSGGQDSFTGALELLNDGVTPLLLSHSASGATNTAQTAVDAFLRRRNPTLQRIKLSARKTPAAVFPGQESSQRSRTLLYIGAACVVAGVSASGRVWLNENGIMAMHLPLTAARIGSLSTHTASPPILARMGALASDVLGTPVTIQNRLVRLTKPDVVGRAVALAARDEMHETVSCWQIGRTREHCGHCIPCLMRRISCEIHGVPDVTYEADLFADASSLDDARARDNLTHLLQHLEDLATLSDLELEYEYPELLNGEPDLTLSEAISMHRRWADQASGVLFAHPVPSSLR